MQFLFEYRKLGDFTYHVLPDPVTIKDYLMKWIMSEWEFDHREAPDEGWTVEWMNTLPDMEFALEIIEPDSIHPRAELMSVEDFQISLKERADEREESILRGSSIEPLLVNRMPPAPHCPLLYGLIASSIVRRHPAAAHRAGGCG
jgi:hypothetical protein